MASKWEQSESGGFFNLGPGPGFPIVKVSKDEVKRALSNRKAIDELLAKKIRDAYNEP
jgi:hypothetical protein